ncbi:acetyltransferase [uncultured Winogradskyella sp.]|uniref:acetyltransferase n=1 Tax=uncultured Winogradskyella sp. TaxID=395353 RepID=UPI003512D899
MSGFKNIHLFGYSGHAYVVIDVALANNFKVLGYFDKSVKAANPYAIAYHGYEQDLDIKTIIKTDCAFPAVGFNRLRKQLVQMMEDIEVKQLSLIDPSAYVSPKAVIGVSTLIAPQATVNSIVKLGKGVIVNTAAIVEHECTIGDFSHIAPGAVLAGNVTVGEQVFIGGNATVKEGVSIGAGATIGAGAVVLTDIPAGETWVGNPAKPMRK